MSSEIPSRVRTALQRSWRRLILTLLQRRHKRLLVRQHRLEVKVQEVERKLYRLSPPPVITVSPQQLERMKQLGELALRPSPILQLFQDPPELEQKPTFVIPPGNARS